MSTAQTIRDAALTWPMPYLSDEESRVLWVFCGLYGVDWDSTESRTFMLIAAASLDGGERLPMSNIQQFRFAMDYLNDGHGLVRAVERHHGIGVGK